MFVERPGIGAAVQCDSCMKFEERKAKFVVRGQDSTRPKEGSRDRFFDIVLPPSVSKITGGPDGRYKGCARSGLPGVLLPMHLCPGCALDLRKCVKFTINRAVFKDGPFDKQVKDAIQIEAIGDPMMMEPGRLRDHLVEIKHKFPQMEGSA